MDKMQEIDDHLKRLQQFKDQINKDIDALTHESYDVKGTMFGFNSRVKTIVSRLMQFSGNQVAEVMHHVVQRGVDRDFDSAQDYLDYISQTISSLRECTNRCDQVIANLQKEKQDLLYKYQSTDNWLSQARDLLK